MFPKKMYIFFPLFFNIAINIVPWTFYRDIIVPCVFGIVTSLLFKATGETSYSPSNIRDLGRFSIARILASKPIFQGCYVIKWRSRTVPMSCILGIPPRPAPLGLGEISRLHMGRLCVLKIPTMLCARTNFPKSVEDVRQGLSYDAHLLACSTLRFPNARKYSCLASEARCSARLCYQASIVAIEKRPLW